MRLKVTPKEAKITLRGSTYELQEAFVAFNITLNHDGTTVALQPLVFASMNDLEASKTDKTIRPLNTSLPIHGAKDEKGVIRPVGIVLNVESQSKEAIAAAAILFYDAQGFTATEI